MLVYPRSDGQGHFRSSARAGRRRAPRSTGITSRRKTWTATGLDPAVVPGALHAALTVLEQWGTMSFEQVSARAIDYAEQGFPLRPRTARVDREQSQVLRNLAGQPAMLAEAGWIDLQGRRDHRSFRPRAHAEAHGRGRARGGGARAGRPASSRRATGSTKATSRAEMVAFLKQHARRWTATTSREFFAKVEEPATTSYRGYQVYKHAFGSQGPVLLEALNILEQFDLKSMKHNSADYLHTVMEALKLAYADRDTYYGDPAFVQTPAEGLLSKDVREGTAPS